MRKSLNGCSLIIASSSYSSKNLVGELFELGRVGAPESCSGDFVVAVVLDGVFGRRRAVQGDGELS